MILPFSTQMNGKPNYFIDKIWCGLLRDDFTMEVEYLEYLDLYQKRFGKSWDVIENFKPKIHTIREDVNDRWHERRGIHFTINNRSKSSFRFAPVRECNTTQQVFMSISNHLEISIDDKYLYHSDKEQLAINDGFENLEDFEAYFTQAIIKKPNQASSFKLIHWTNFKY